MNRFSPVFAVAAASFASVAAAQGPASAPTEGSSARLRTLPEQIFFTTSNSKENISGAIFFLIVEEPAGQSSTAEGLDLTFRKGDQVVRTERLSPTALGAIDFPGLPATRLHSPQVAQRVHWPHAYRLPLTLHAKAGADSVEARVTLLRDGRRQTLAAILPVRNYEQKTALIFPFKGPGIISQGGALVSGHRNRSGLYAIDALGLNATYGPMIEDRADDDPQNYSGWGREIIAPAAGKILVARSDRPDQPVAEKSNPAYLLPQYAQGGDPGNYVIIDHDNGEFSMIAHMQKDSVRVKVGDRVAQGQVLGVMGNSGDSYGPHVHYQLQNGADWERSDALPHRFTNVRASNRGDYFKAE